VQNRHAKPGHRLYVDDQGLVVGATSGDRPTGTQARLSGWSSARWAYARTWSGSCAAYPPLRLQSCRGRSVRPSVGRRSVPG